MISKKDVANIVFHAFRITYWLIVLIAMGIAYGCVYYFWIPTFQTCLNGNTHLTGTQLLMVMVIIGAVAQVFTSVALVMAATRYIVRLYEESRDNCKH